MKINAKTIFYLISVTLFLQSCKDIISMNISGVTPEFIIPLENDTTNINPVHFKWKEIEGATKFRLEVVSPSFSSINLFSIDTILMGTNFLAPLDSNEYEMRITALNSGYESKTSDIIHFWVGVKPTTGSSQVVLIEPENNSYHNEQFNGVFDWENTLGAESYEFYLKKGSSFESGTPVDYSSGLEISSKNINTSLLIDGEYYWGVRAYYSNGTESVLSKFNFFIDTENPVQPTLQQPFNNATLVTGLINFSWSSGPEQGTVIAPTTSILEISTDIGFSQSDLYYISGNSMDLTINGNLGQVYYWRVRNRDDAGNHSSYSTIFNFSF